MESLAWKCLSVALACGGISVRCARFWEATPEERKLEESRLMKNAAYLCLCSIIFPFIMFVRYFNLGKPLFGHPCTAFLWYIISGCILLLFLKTGSRRTFGFAYAVLNLHLPAVVSMISTNFFRYEYTFSDVDALQSLVVGAVLLPASAIVSNAAKVEMHCTSASFICFIMSERSATSILASAESTIVAVLWVFACNILFAHMIDNRSWTAGSNNDVALYLILFVFVLPYRFAPDVVESFMPSQTTIEKVLLPLLIAGLVFHLFADYVSLDDRIIMGTPAASASRKSSQGDRNCCSAFPFEFLFDVSIYMMLFFAFQAPLHPLAVGIWVIFTTLLDSIVLIKGPDVVVGRQNSIRDLLLRARVYNFRVLPYVMCSTYATKYIHGALVLCPVVFQSPQDVSFAFLMMGGSLKTVLFSFAYRTPISESLAHNILFILLFRVMAPATAVNATLAWGAVFVAISSSLIRFILYRANWLMKGALPKEACPIDRSVLRLRIFLPACVMGVALTMGPMHSMKKEIFLRSGCFAVCCAVSCLTIIASRRDVFERMDDWVVKSAVRDKQFPYEAPEYASMYWRQFRPYRPNLPEIEPQISWFLHALFWLAMSILFSGLLIGVPIYLPDRVEIGGYSFSILLSGTIGACAYSWVGGKHEYYVHYALWCYWGVYLTPWMYLKRSMDMTTTHVWISVALMQFYDPFTTHIKNYSFSHGLASRFVGVLLFSLKYKDVLDDAAAKRVVSPHSELSVIHFLLLNVFAWVAIGFLAFSMFYRKHRHAYIKARRSLFQRRKIQMLEDSSKRQLINSFRLSFPNFAVVDWRTLEQINKGMAALSNKSAASLQSKEFDFSSLSFMYILSRSRTSSLFCAKLKSGKMVAVRSPNFLVGISQEEMNTLLGRLAAFASVLHPNIVAFHGHCWSPVPCIVLDFLPFDTVADTVFRIGGRYAATNKLPDLDRWMRFTLKVFTRISGALAYLHAKQVHYGCVCLKYIRTYEDNRWGDDDYRLSDLPLVSTSHDERGMVLPLEVLRGEACLSDYPSDIYAFGMCMWQVCMFEHKRPADVDDALVLIGMLPRYVRPAVKSLISLCMSSRAAYRPTAENIARVLGDEMAAMEAQFLAGGSGRSKHYPHFPKLPVARRKAQNKKRVMWNTEAESASF